MKKRIALSALLMSIGMSTTFAYASPVNLEKNIAQINSSIEKANYRGADEVVYKTLSVYKDNYDVQALAAVSWALQSKLELAQDQIDRLKNVIPKNSDLHFAQGVVFFKRMASSDLDYRNKQENLADIAVREFRYAIQLNPNNYKAYNALGVMELRSGNVDEAQRNIEKALQLRPNYAVAIDNLGSVYLAKGDVSAAEHYFKKAVSINQNSSTAYYHLAQLEYEKGNYSKCLTYINKCLAWKGYSSYAYNLRGDALRKQGNEAAAIGAYKKAIEITPENLAPYANLAAIYETRKDFELALDLYKTILTISPESSQTHLKIADLYLESEKYNLAIQHYEKVGAELRSEALKGLASAYYAVAMNSVAKSAFASDKKLLEAVGFLDKAIGQSPEDLELYLAKAKLSALLNCPKDFYDNLTNVLSKPCVGIDDYLLKGDANLALSNYKDGFADYQSAIKLADTNDKKLYLGELFMFSKLYDEAEAVYNSLLNADEDNLVAKNSLAYIKLVRTNAAKQTDNADYFRKRFNKFFQREYLNKALKINPYDVRANFMMGKLNQRQRKYEEAYSNYSIVVAKTKDVYTLTSATDRMNTVKNKIDRKIEKEKARVINAENKAKADAIKAKEREEATLVREQEKAIQAQKKEEARLLKAQQDELNAQEREKVKLQKEEQEKNLAQEREQAKMQKEQAKEAKKAEKEKARLEKEKAKLAKKEAKINAKNLVPVSDVKQDKKSTKVKKNKNVKPKPPVDYSLKDM